MTNQSKRVSHFYVFIQLAGIVLSYLPLKHRALQHPYFLVISMLGMILVSYTLWHNRFGNFGIYPEVKEGAKLITSGPYRFIRHPMYTSLLLLLAGSSLYFNHPVNYVGLLLVGVAVWLKAIKEEGLLAARYPEYDAYKKKTAGFIPFIF